MTRKNYTPEEIAAAHDRNESFIGKQANLTKIQLYHSVKSDLVKLMEHCEAMKQVDGFAPNVHEKHAIIWLDFSPAAILSTEETRVLAAVMCKVDGMVISAVDSHVRVTFDIKNIWEDGD